VYAVNEHPVAGRRGSDFAIRRKFLLGLMLCGVMALVYRAVDLQILNKSFLQEKALRQHVDEVSVPAYRGQIKDRLGEPLAISTPVESVWVNPQSMLDEEQEKHRILGKLLGLPARKLEQLADKANGRRFVYLKRHINPDLATKIKGMQISGVHFQKEFRRFYPAAEVTGHLLGFNDIDDVGQEGMERGYEASLKGIAGYKAVIKDGSGKIIKDVENIKEPVAGQELRLTIDSRIQALAYRELQATYVLHKARAAALVVLDAKNGEVLAVTNQPAFNPNTRKGLSARLYRNRAVVDVFEPGSTVKPFVVAAALEGGYVSPDEMIETHGFFRVGRNLVRDIHNYGTLDLMHVLKKSSNVAVSKIALQMPPEYFWDSYHRLGFGVAPGVGFPGEASGALQDYQQWNEFEQATKSFGYGMSTSVLQLARAYTALADDGVLHSVTLLERDEDYEARRVFSPATARAVRAMMEHVIRKDGTAYKARVEGYRVAGKTGTVKKAAAGGYSDNSYLAVFVGMAPASDPRFVIAVMVDEPGAGDYYGGLVAAPVFSKVMAGALRIYGVAPDQMDTMPVLLAKRK
jgi:cell division protein FtsI (penicillin-binding protein 3)